MVRRNATHYLPTRLFANATHAPLRAGVCDCEQATGSPAGYASQRSVTVSASHHPTDIHLRQHRLKKRNKLRARIAAGPASGRAALEARVLRTYSPFHSFAREKPE